MPVEVGVIVGVVLFFIGCILWTAVSDGTCGRKAPIILHLISVPLLTWVIFATVQSTTVEKTEDFDVIEVRVNNFIRHIFYDSNSDVALSVEKLCGLTVPPDQVKQVFVRKTIYNKYYYGIKFPNSSLNDKYELRYRTSI